MTDIVKVYQEAESVREAMDIMGIKAHSWFYEKLRRAGGEAKRRPYTSDEDVKLLRQLKGSITAEEAAKKFDMSASGVRGIWNYHRRINAGVEK